MNAFKAPILTPLMKAIFMIQSQSDTFPRHNLLGLVIFKMIIIIVLRYVGEYEPNDEECEWPSDDESDDDDEDGENDKEAKEKKKEKEVSHCQLVS